MSDRRSISVRDITVLAMLVALNVALELTLGSLLHLIRFPLTGSLMVVVNAIVYTLGYRYRSNFGIITAMGVLTALLSFTTSGGLKMMVLPAICIEALVIDIAISLTHGSFGGFVLAGALASLTAFLMMIVNRVIFMGLPLQAALEKVASFGDGANVSVTLAFVGMCLYRLAVGAIIALLLWRAYRLLEGLMLRIVSRSAPENTTAQALEPKP